MPTPSVFTTASFIGIVLVVLLLFLRAARRAGIGAPPVAAIVLVYLAAPAMMARIGVLDRYDPLPPPALVLVFALTVLTIVLAFSRAGARLAHALPIGAIVALQAFRIPVEWILYRLHAESVIPVQMTFAGRNFDIITGITALLLGAWLLGRRSPHRGLVWVWNVMGLVLLINIVAMAALSTPVPFRQFTDGPANLLPGRFPWVWLPSFLVQVALASHLLVFRKLALDAAADPRAVSRETDARSSDQAMLQR